MIDRLAAWLVYDLFGLDPASRLGTSVHFFFYDTVKIILLLIIIGTAMGIVNAYFPIERLRRFLSRTGVSSACSTCSPHCSEPSPPSAPVRRSPSSSDSSREVSRSASPSPS